MSDWSACSARAPVSSVGEDLAQPRRSARRLDPVAGREDDLRVRVLDIGVAGGREAAVAPTVDG